mmetsp:Transcript_14204/g.38511  ORF Transcript_14204/g.38511 Transcript_14204/m.38511 type:complete len:130 (+) Transcript_14204:1241-1630(+)
MYCNRMGKASFPNRRTSPVVCAVGEVKATGSPSPPLSPPLLPVPFCDVDEEAAACSASKRFFSSVCRAFTAVFLVGLLQENSSLRNGAGLQGGRLKALGSAVARSKQFRSNMAVGGGVVQQQEGIQMKD